MTSRYRLLAGVALAAATIASDPASAAPKKKAAASSTAANAALLKEVEALKEQVEALTARLDVQEAGQRESVATIANTQATATAAATQAQAAQTAAVAAQTAVPAEVKTALASQPKGPAKWFDNTSISGRSYFNISHIDQHSDGRKVASSTAYDIKRFYLGVDHKFNDVFSANITTDVSVIAQGVNVYGTGVPGAATQPTNAANGFNRNIGETLYLKKAYLQASLGKAVNFRIGSSDLPWVPFVEDLYGYRWVENTLIDRTGFGTSADWGAHMFGALADDHLTYAVSAIDGAGYRNPLRSKTMDVEGRVAVNYKGVTAAVGGYIGKRGNDQDYPYSPTNTAVLLPQVTPNTLAPGVAGDVQTRQTAKRFNAVLAYATPVFRIGGEYFYAKNWNRVTAATEDTSDGYSGWASYNFYKTFSVFGKYEHTTPFKDTFPNLKETYFNAGVAWEPVKIVDLGIVYKRERVEHGYFGATNTNPDPGGFTIPVGGINSGYYSEIGLFGQFRF